MTHVLLALAGLVMLAVVVSLALLAGKITTAGAAHLPDEDGSER